MRLLGVCQGEINLLLLGIFPLKLSVLRIVSRLGQILSCRCVDEVVAVDAVVDAQAAGAMLALRVRGGKNGGWYRLRVDEHLEVGAALLLGICEDVRSQEAVSLFALLRGFLGLFDFILLFLLLQLEWIDAFLHRHQRNLVFDAGLNVLQFAHVIF